METTDITAESAAAKSQATRETFAAAEQGSQHIVASRCVRCDHVDFPPSSVCARCLSLDLAPLELSDRGTLYTFTSMTAAGERILAGYVDLPEGIRTFAEIDDRAGRPVCGQPVRLIERRAAGTAPRRPRFVFSGVYEVPNV